MANFFVAYDLFSPEKNYNALLDEIHTVGRVAELVRSVWYVNTNLDEIALRDRLRTVMQPQDRLLVIAASNANGFGLDRGMWQAVREEWNTSFTPAVEPGTSND